MRLFTVQQSQASDKKALMAKPHGLGMSLVQLMEAAANAVVEDIYQSFRKQLNKKILVFVGPGNNGADGFACARLLKRKGFSSVQCVTLAPNSPKSEMWVFQNAKAKNSGVPILELSLDRLKLEINDSDILVDAIFGTGLSRPIGADIHAVIEFVNSRRKWVVSVDTPSGLDADSGMVQGTAIQAQRCVTFGLAKPGFFIQAGPAHVGKLVVNPIGFPRSLLRECSGTHFAFGPQAARRVMPKRNPLSNKSSHGTVHVIAGSSEFPGAGLLSSLAAARTGAGYVRLSSFSDVYALIPQMPEVIAGQIQKFSDLKLAKNSKKTAFVVGPGLGISLDTKNLIVTLKKHKIEKVVLDADAIRVCSQEKLWPVPSSWILTPHTGELAEVLKVDANQINADRWNSAHKAALKTGGIVLLKGFRTVIADTQRAIVVLSGNSALAKGGSGDVLAGMIGGLLAQGTAPLTAACLGAYIHGRLADEWILEGKDVLSLLPSDLSSNLPGLLRRIRDQKII